MGISHLNYDLIETSLKELGRDNFKGLDIVQFGHLNFTMDLAKTPLPGEKKVYKYSRKYFLAKGARRCLDIDWGLNKKRDLGKPLFKKWDKRFDLLNNYGTSEHVYDQYECFKNAHNIMKDVGVMIHVVPHVGSYPTHCLFWYSSTFFSQLAAINNYKVISEEVRPKPFPVRELVCAILKKEHDKPFCSKEDFYKMWDGSGSTSKRPRKE
jgi:hypothetical protein